MRASQELFSAIKQAFKLTWQSDIPRPDALDQLEAEYGHLPEIKIYIDFIRQSKRGIIANENKD